MLEFKPIDLPWQEQIEACLGHFGAQSYEECFSTLYTWKDRYHTHFAFTDDCVIFRMWDQEYYYLPPIGAGNFGAALAKLIDHTKEQGHRLRLICLTKPTIDRIEAVLPGVFSYSGTRDICDYLHLTESLAEFKGKKFHAKRNHVKKFTTKYDYEYRPLTEDLVPAVLELTRLWCGDRLEQGDRDAIADLRSCELLFSNMERLSVEGGAIFVEGRMIAAAAGTPLYPGSDTIVVHYEKALTEYDGIYPTICQLFMQQCKERYTWANREEDLGIEGLRKSKLSYYPEQLLEKFEALYQG